MTVKDNMTSYLQEPDYEEKWVSYVTETNISLDTCAAYSLCKDPKFSPDSQTIVTEWNLVCDRAWILSFIISVQMAGVTVGSFLWGYLGDRVGRKRTMYGTVALDMLASGAAYFTTSWQAFTVVRFIIGITSGGSLAFSQIYALEFASQNWRPVITGFPSWQIGTLTFGVCAMLVRDWRHVQLATSAVCLLALLTAVWVPDSVRWLLVHQKTNSAKRVIRQISRFNRTTIPELESTTTFTTTAKSEDEDAKYGVTMLFHKSLLRSTILLFIILFFVNGMFFTIGFGVGTLYGDFYLNYIIYSILPMPFSFLSPMIANKLGRKKALLVFLILIFLSFACIVVVFFTTSDPLRGYTITAFALLIGAWLQLFISLTNAFMVELFPTVARYLAYGFVLTGARLGSIVAPFAIPREFETLYVPYLAMCAISLLCCLAVRALPETKGVDLEDLLNDNKLTPSEGKNVHGEAGKDQSAEHGLLERRL